MVIQRQGYAIIVKPIAQQRINEGKCASCGKPKSEWNRRTDWRCCSVECTDYFECNLIIRGWDHMRSKVFKRDDYTCVKCGFVAKDDDGWILWHKLVADHVHPIALGGDEWDINGIQTLCEDCNKIKTREDHRNIAKQRAIEKKLTGGQKTLEFQ